MDWQVKVKDLDDTLSNSTVDYLNGVVYTSGTGHVDNVALAKSPKVVNEPYSENEDWNWNWNKDADAIINKFGWAGLAKACAWYDPNGAEEKDENGYPKAKSAYYLPHHKLIDGELTLVKGGVVAAMKRLLQTKARKEKGDIDTKINFKEAYKHLVGHYKFFEMEPPDLDKSEASLLEYPVWYDNYEFNTDLEVGEITSIVIDLLRHWLNDVEYLISVLLPFSDDELDDERLNRVLDALNVFDALKTKLTKVLELYDVIKQAQGGTKMELKELLQKIEAGEVDKEALKEALGFVEVSELEVLKKELEELRQAKESIEKEYQEFRKAVEEEKEARRKAELAEARFKELVEAGIEFSEDRIEKVKSKLAEMDEEAYSDYKAELLDVLASKKKKKAEEEENEEEAKRKKSKANENIFGDEINNEVYNPELAFELRQRRAALNVELKPVDTDLDLVKKFQNILFGEVK